MKLKPHKDYNMEFVEVLLMRLVSAYFVLRTEKGVRLKDLKKELSINYRYLIKAIKLGTSREVLIIVSNKKEFEEEDLWVKLTEKGMREIKEYIQ